MVISIYRGASFLCSCILHGYFNSIRLLALQVYKKSHCPGKSYVTHFHLLDLQRILSFPSKEEVRQ